MKKGTVRAGFGSRNLKKMDGSTRPNPEEVTQILREVASGDSDAASTLLPLVYEELRRLAGAYLAQERVDHTLQPTALVHEAFLRLVHQEDSNWESRAHFYRVAALAMRRVLVNHARDRKRLKRGGGVRPVPLEGVGEHDGPTEDLIALDEALERLAALDDRKVQVVQLRYFGGFTIDETAQILGISPSQIKRDWTAARAFLLREMSGGPA
ncbi:MAG: sigma-70 family RNA polymerase sigma factor [Phycisphaerales bacterium]|nr:sigma-70 family RNA polymerase sigma factor [Phycisphaerales bacterium]